MKSNFIFMSCSMFMPVFVCFGNCCFQQLIRKNKVSFYSVYKDNEAIFNACIGAKDGASRLIVGYLSVTGLPNVLKSAHVRVKNRF